MIREACVESFQEAVLAQKRGAERIELCADLEVGGITPSYALIESVRKVLKIPVMVMIRPRGGDFFFNSHEIKIMKQSIDVCKHVGVAGIVTGLLNKEGEIDISNTIRLIDYALPLQVTFHKAIDETFNPVKSAGILTEISGVTRILTSGGAPTALEGKDVINKMIDTTENRITIIAAGKVTQKNLTDLMPLIRTDEFHGRKIVGKLSSETNET